MTIYHSFLYINGWQAWYRCADPGIFIRGGGGGGGGGGEGPGQSDKKALTTIFLVLCLFYRSNRQFQRNLSFFKAPDGVQFFPGGPTFSRGVKLIIPYRNPFNLRFSRGGPDPLPPPPPSGSALGAALTASWLRLLYIISFGLGKR